MFFDWDPSKEEWLNEHRGLSFHHFLYHVQKGDLLDLREHGKVAHNNKPSTYLEIDRDGGHASGSFSSLKSPFSEDGLTGFPVEDCMA